MQQLMWIEKSILKTFKKCLVILTVTVLFFLSLSVSVYYNFHDFAEFLFLFHGCNWIKFVHVPRL